MDQPLDFSKPSMINTQAGLLKNSTLTIKKQQSRSNTKSVKGLSEVYQLHNSENSDETQSRSSASSPDSLQNEQNTLNFNNLDNASLSQQALFMLAAVSNPKLAAMNYKTQLINNSSQSDLNSNFINQLNNFTSTNTTESNYCMMNAQKIKNNNNPFLTSQKPCASEAAAHAATVAISNIISQSQLSSFANHLNQSNHREIVIPTNAVVVKPTNFSQAGSRLTKNSHQTKSAGRPSTNQKVVSRKSIILAMQQQDEQKSTKTPNQLQSSMNSSTSTKFGILSNSQNSNILQIDTDNESEISNSQMNSNSLQISINSNMSGEENSIYGDLFSQDDNSPKSQRRRGNPIPESLKDDSYWVRRRKNNDAAKKSRDAKRSKDLITAKRAVMLENENNQLKMQLNQIKSENLILRAFLGEEVFCEDKQQIDKLISASRQVDPEKIRQFSQAIFGKDLHCSKNVNTTANIENMES